MKTNRGFTYLELLIVTAIIAIILAIAIPWYKDYSSRPDPYAQNTVIFQFPDNGPNKFRKVYLNAYLLLA